MDNRTKQVTLRLPMELYARFKQQADIEERSVSSQILYLAKKGKELARQERQEEE